MSHDGRPEPQMRNLKIVALVVSLVPLLFELVQCFSFGVPVRDFASKALRAGSVHWVHVIAWVLMLAGLTLSYTLWLPKATAVARKELRTYFTSPVAYVVMAAYFLIAGILIWFMIAGTGGEASFSRMIGSFYFLLMLLTPMLTMRLFAEEKRSGTIELLMTSPVRDIEVVVGKFVAASLVVMVMLAVTFELPIIIEVGGRPDWGPVWSGFFGLALLSLTFVAIGLLCSSFTHSQIAAAGAAWGILLVLWLVNWFKQFLATGAPLAKQFSSLAEYMSIYYAMDRFSSGTFDTAQVVYFVSVIVFALFLTTRVLETARAR